MVRIYKWKLKNLFVNLVVIYGGEVIFMDLIQLMKALADETRMRILNILKDEELCVCEIEAVLDITQSNTSRHLNRLTNAKILDNYKVGNYVYYKIDKDVIKKISIYKRNYRRTHYEG